MNTLILCTFPGVGKTFFCKNTKKKVLDDSNLKHNPKEYVELLKHNMGKFDVIFINHDKETRTALVDAGIRFYMIYPKHGLVEIYRERLIGHGYDEKFVSDCIFNWGSKLVDFSCQGGCDHIVLGSGGYISQFLG